MGQKLKYPQVLPIIQNEAIAKSLFIINYTCMVSRIITINLIYNFYIYIPVYYKLHK